MKALASMLRRLADRIDAPMVPLPIAPEASASTAARGRRIRTDDEFVDELILRDALHRALNRYSPLRLPAQA